MGRRLLVASATLLIFWANSELFAEGSNQNLAISSDSLKPKPRYRPVGPKDIPGPPKPQSADTRVLFITSTEDSKSQEVLAKLNRPGGEFTALRQRGWKIGSTPDNQIQIVDRTEVADFVRELNVHEFPTVACVSEGKIIRAFKDGCTTPLDSWTFGWLFKGRNERPNAPVLETARVASTGSYRLRGNHWSVDGDWNPSFSSLVNHLRSPIHAYSISSAWKIENWSYEELRSLHDDLHEREMGSASYSSYQRPVSDSQIRSAGSKITGK